MLTLEVDGVALHCAVEGREGAPWLALSGSLGTDLRVWDALVPLLSERFQVLRYDLRGHGLSDAPAGPAPIERHADDLAGLLDGVGVKRAALVGVSVGGMVVLALTARRPDLVRAVVLCDTGHRIGNPEAWQARIDAVRRGGLAPIADAVLERWFSERYRREHPAALRGWRNMLLRTPAQGYADACAALRDADLGAAAAALRVPALCLCGSEDQATPPELTRTLAGLIPGARFEALEGAAHLPHVEQPAALAERIEEFLREGETT